MADIFTRQNAQDILQNRVVWFFGDSNMRAIYKDLVWLLQKNSLVGSKALKSKLEKSYLNDSLQRGKTLHSARDYEEERRFDDKLLHTTLEFMFLTRCITPRLKAKFQNISSEASSPDLVIINSLLWDICRWGPDGVTAYKKKIPQLLKLMKRCLHPKTLVIWLTTPPLAASIYGALVIKQIEYMQHSARFEVMEGNLFVRQEVISHGFDVLDLHYHLLLHIHRRCADGIHWEPRTVRHITNLILTHVALSWGHPLPGNFKGSFLSRMAAKQYNNQENKKEEATLQQLEELPVTKAVPDKPKKKSQMAARNRNKNLATSSGRQQTAAGWGSWSGQNVSYPNQQSVMTAANEWNQTPYLGSGWNGNQNLQVPSWAQMHTGNFNYDVTTQPAGGHGVNQRLEQIANASWEQLQRLGLWNGNYQNSQPPGLFDFRNHGPYHYGNRPGGRYQPY